MRRIVLILMAAILGSFFTVSAQKVTVNAENQPAAVVFRTLIEQTGKNFVYSSDILDGVNVTVKATKRPLKKVLAEMFEGTGIEFKIKGNDVILKRSAKRLAAKPVSTPILATPTFEPDTNALLLEEVVVLSRLEQPAVATSEIGAKKVTADEVRNTPVLFGEADVIKALQMQPGVVEGTEGMAGMHVHGGDGDQNLYMLDNVPLYQVNHFAGLFSAFNTDIIRYIDFFKSSMPAKYDGRLSSFMDVRLQNGNFDGHHGSLRLGLTSGAFNLSGPIGKKTSYVVGLRRSWYDVLTVPMLALINSKEEEKIRFQYYFMDLNAKVTHRFSSRATAFASVYFGDDMLKTGSKDRLYDGYDGSVEDDKYDFHWGNLVAQAGLNYRINPQMSAEFTAAYTRFFSDMRHRDTYNTKTDDGKPLTTEERMRTDNNINDWIFRGDFDWQPMENSRVRFGANYVRHSFLPARTSRLSVTETSRIETRDSTWAYGANELNAYIEDDWRICDHFSANAGIHASLFCIDGKAKHGISPRLSLSYRPNENFAVKAAYSRATQYVHQLSQTYLALPTDQWIPITGKFKPQTSDKIAIGGYWESDNKIWAASVEGYYKWMHHLLDYRDEYYLKPPLEMWNARLTQGSGTAKGIDFKVEKVYGKLTGHIAYSLAWADRKFAGKNGGLPFPARFDNRHTINVLLNWNVSDRVQLNAAWTGHSGNRFTLLSQIWEGPEFDDQTYWDNAPLRAKINNYQLPFYHRLDLSCVVKNKRGFWTFSLYNAYCHLNTIAIRRAYKEVHEMTEYGYVGSSVPVFQKVKLLPIIPSISYTWQF